MKTAYLIIIAIFILILLAIRYQYNERKAGIPVGSVKVCSPTNANDCHFVDEKIVNAVYAKALAVANADEAQTFPVEVLDDWGTTYEFNQSELAKICQSAANQLNIDINVQKTAPLASIHELILFLHTHQTKSPNS